MSFAGPNLAREPFANLRPLRRTAAALWLAAVALTGWNVAAYVRSGAGVADRAAELERLRRTTAEDRARAETLEADLRRADLALANARTDFLNRRIDERAFSWNLLLDRLSETLPRGVRLQRLAPQAAREDRPRPARAGGAPEARTVALQIAGEAEDDESLLEFVDRLFAHPAFDRPDLEREARSKAGTLTFTLRAEYQPAAGPVDGGAAAPQTAPATVAAAPGAAASRSAPIAPRAQAAAPSAATADANAAATGVSAAPGRVAVGGAAPGRGPRAVAPAPAATGATAAAAEREATLNPGAGAAATAPAEEGAAAPRPSIFGAPWAARPYASSGGGR